MVKHRYDGIRCRHANPLVLNAIAWDTGWTQNKTKVPRVISETAVALGRYPGEEAGHRMLKGTLAGWKKRK